MLDQMFIMFETLEDIFWTYGGIPMLLGLGIYLSFKSGWFQIRQLSTVFSIFKSFMTQESSDKQRGVNPMYAFFASVGGCIGVGNVISVCTAVQVGGPGAVFWIWVAALLGMLVKYGEIYLGVKFRIKDKADSYFGGPMIFLKKVPGGAILAPIVTILMCLYGVEVYMFKIMTHSMSVGWGINQYIVIAMLLFLVLGIGQGGVKLVGKMSSFVIPLFLVGFSGMSLWVFAMNFAKIPAMLSSIFVHAFTAHAAVGAFAGSTMMMAMSHGIRRACYTADIGVGYAATIHAETSEAVPQKQASLGIMDIILDTFVICTLSMFVILLTDTWHQGISEDFVVAVAFAKYFPYVDVIWPFFIFLLGYSSLLAFFVSGRRSAMLLSPKYGAQLYLLFAAAAFVFFSFYGTPAQTMAVMSIVGTLLLMINLYGLFWLRDEVVFDLKQK
ncbi:MAG: sodium/alanine symporter protein [Epsilonproteobacteria bacterium]|nr:sodium/alanine symporter protein [Campylobacterota bacterium]|tara:strand:- start:2334 stop:3656 length:1323 start_codon:yes stop_codon:yes gene_type:complete